jgi:hypothetical protein
VHITLEDEMKLLTGMALLLGLAACNTRGDQETGRVGAGADTTVTQRTTQDTTIVKADTTMDVDVDTVRREGDRAVNRDTVKH